MENKLRKILANSDDVEPGPGTAAVAIVLREGPEVLLVKRVEREGDPWSGQVAFPGGRWRPGDMDFIATALRELYEEAYLPAEAVGFIGFLETVSPRNVPTLKVKPVVFRLLHDVSPHPGAEVSKVFWLPLTNLPMFYAKVYSRHLNREVVTEAYSYGGELIWGMTARLISVLQSAFA
ncbi:MAG: CoA pyrophosphatase [Candidatus Caldarchaeum sp.]|uniref:CoA pyrophosphatase n=1 Tax=Caldiarchaeum subterraneum TaxID=311458 RepID=A0A7C4I402_CALS0|nr:CoA pyrophosphatase [Candidatus Caldarchaeales archaeon]MDJ0273265.1 CoA pyrophosphatase [Candidatus Caldarchaeales archaeon]